MQTHSSKHTEIIEHVSITKESPPALKLRWVKMRTAFAEAHRKMKACLYKIAKPTCTKASVGGGGLQGTSFEPATRRFEANQGLYYAIQRVMIMEASASLHRR